MQPRKKPKRKPEAAVPDHHIPLAKFVQSYGNAGEIPVDVEAMLQRAGIKVRQMVTQTRNGVKLVESGNDMVLSIYLNTRESMYTTTRRAGVATVFALFLSGAPAERWEWFDDHTGHTHNDPYDIFAQRFAYELLVPMPQLREFLKGKLPLARREVWQAIADKFEVPLFYAVQRVAHLEYLMEQESKA